MRLTEFCEISLKEIESYLKSLDPLESLDPLGVSLCLSGGMYYSRIMKKSNKYGIRYIQIRRLAPTFPDAGGPESSDSDGSIVLDFYFSKLHLISFRIINYEVKSIQVSNGISVVAEVCYVENDYKNKTSIKSLITSNQSVSILFCNKDELNGRSSI